MFSIRHAINSHRRNQWMMGVVHIHGCVSYGACVRLWAVHNALWTTGHRCRCQTGPPRRAISWWYKQVARVTDVCQARPGFTTQLQRGHRMDHLQLFRGCDAQKPPILVSLGCWIADSDTGVTMEVFSVVKRAPQWTRARSI